MPGDKSIYRQFRLITDISFTNVFLFILRPIHYWRQMLLPFFGNIIMLMSERSFF